MSAHHSFGTQEHDDRLGKKEGVTGMKLSDAGVLRRILREELSPLVAALCRICAPAPGILVSQMFNIYTPVPSRRESGDDSDLSDAGIFPRVNLGETRC